MPAGRDNSSPTCGSPMAVSNSYLDSLRLISVAALYPGAGADRNFLRPAPSRVGCHASGSVAGNLGFRSIGVEEPCPHIRVSEREKATPRRPLRRRDGDRRSPAELRNIGAERTMPSMIRKSFPQAFALTKGMTRSRWRHSVCTGPRGTTVSSSEDCFKACSALAIRELNQ